NEKIFFVGNTMIDTLVTFHNQIGESDVLKKYKIEREKFVLMTMHRPATVDNKEGLSKLIELINLVTKKYKLLFPIHPRTLKNIELFGLSESISENKNIIYTEPLDYFSFQKLIFESKFILTDSGGIQEESTFLRKPCLTLRPNTERPITVTTGTNTLVPFDIQKINNHILEIENGTYKKGEIPELWDGKATERILQILNAKI
ncbi:MAG: UDP-N-acetylglucosamine 2-epimerase, partial [Bacteroidia bacterium]